MAILLHGRACQPSNKTTPRDALQAAYADMATFVLSGLTPVSGTRTKRQPDIPIIRSVVNGNAGQFLMTVKADPAAASFEAKYAALINGTPAVWVAMPFTKARSVSINGLQPASTYVMRKSTPEKPMTTSPPAVNESSG